MDNVTLLMQIEALEQNLARVERIQDADAFPAGYSRVQYRFLQELRRHKNELGRLKDQVQGGEVTLKEAWASFIATRRDSGPVLRECLEFLGGVAVREKGLDRGICEVADALVEGYAERMDMKWGRLTILGQEHFVDRTADIIRLRFPEWDVWNLPFTAHEFGHVVASQMREYDDAVTELGLSARSSSYFNELFADAFAVFVMGPAYPCASILLRFDPSAALADGPSHPARAKRVHLMLETLRKIDASLRGSGPFATKGPYTDFIDTLEQVWEATLKGAGVGDGLTDGEKGVLNLWLHQIYDGILDRTFGAWVRYTSWTAAQALSEQLLEDRPASKKLSGKEGLRDVINAAWYCRLTGPPDADRTKEIDRAASKLCIELLSARQARAVVPGQL